MTKTERIKQLEAALKPFADAADGFELRPGHTNSADDEWGLDGDTALTVGDLRRAKEVLNADSA